MRHIKRRAKAHTTSGPDDYHFATKSVRSPGLRFVHTYSTRGKLETRLLDDRLCSGPPAVSVAILEDAQMACAPCCLRLGPQEGLAEVSPRTCESMHAVASLWREFVCESPTSSLGASCHQHGTNPVPQRNKLVELPPRAGVYCRNVNRVVS
jgi:hypothetical protein